jgi:FtsP/CotA-like multicopper oxidase with cupredoxin domain
MLTALVTATAALAQGTGTTTPATTAAQPPVVTSDAATKTVKVGFVAGHGTHNNGLNYNGDAKGEKTLTVPLGWTVEVSLSNAGRLPHDFAIVNGTTVPANIGTARLAFPDAASKVITTGATADTVKFTASRPGTYLILCRVGRHAANGMYVKLTVANGVKAVSYK